jgi:hypothetical protein
MTATAQVEHEASAKAAAQKAKVLMDRLAMEKDKREAEDARSAERVAKLEATRDETAASMAKAKARDALEAMKAAASMALNALRLASTARAGEAAKQAAAALQRSRTQSSISSESGGHTAGKNALATVSKDYVEEKEYKLRMDNLKEAPGHQSMYPPLMGAAIAAAAMALGRAKGQQAKEMASQQQKDAGMVDAGSDMIAAEASRSAAASDEVAGATASAQAAAAKAAAASRLADACKDKIKALALSSIEGKADLLAHIKALKAPGAKLAAAKNEAIGRATSHLREKLAQKVRDLGEHRLKLEREGAKNKEDETDALRRRIAAAEERMVHETAMRDDAAAVTRDAAAVHSDNIALLKHRVAMHAAELARESLERYVLSAHGFLAHSKAAANAEEFAAEQAQREAARLTTEAQEAEAHAAAEAAISAKAKREGDEKSREADKAAADIARGVRTKLAAKTARSAASDKADTLRRSLIDAEAARQNLQSTVAGLRRSALRLRAEAARLETEAQSCRARAVAGSDEVDALTEQIQQAEHDAAAPADSAAAGDSAAATTTTDQDPEAQPELTLDDLGLDAKDDTHCDVKRRPEAKQDTLCDAKRRAEARELGAARRLRMRSRAGAKARVGGGAHTADIEEVRTIKDTL